MMRFLHRILRDQEGTATIELALAAPILATLVAGTVDLTLAFNRKLVLEQAVQRSIERVMQTTTDLTVEENIQADIHDAAGSDVVVDVEFRLTCADEGGDPVEVDFASECGEDQIEARYISVEARDIYTPLIPLENIGIGSGNLTLVATAGVRTR